jgi:hypothetical protein
MDDSVCVRRCECNDTVPMRPAVLQETSHLVNFHMRNHHARSVIDEIWKCVFVGWLSTLAPTLLPHSSELYHVHDNDDSSAYYKTE